MLVCFVDGDCFDVFLSKVMIWDDYQNKCIAELEFQSDVRNIVYSSLLWSSSFLCS